MEKLRKAHTVQPQSEIDKHKKARKEEHRPHSPDLFDRPEKVSPSSSPPLKAAKRHDSPESPRLQERPPSVKAPVEAPAVPQTFSILKKQTIEDFQAIGMAPPPAQDQQYASWRIVSRAVSSVWKYGSALFSTVPAINEQIARLTGMVDTELKSQNLKNATKEQLDQFNKDCLQMLENVQMHEYIVETFADKHLFFGKESPVLGSYAQEKAKVLEQLERIAKRTVALANAPQPECLETKPVSALAPQHEALETKPISKIATSIIAKQVNSVGELDSKELLALCDSVNFRITDDPNFLVYLRLHLILQDASPTYRSIMAELRERQSEDPRIKKGTPLTVLTDDGLQFEAEWNRSNHAVRINAKALGPDFDKDGKVGTSLAFEITNALQDKLFSDVHRGALAREFEGGEMLDADQYIQAMEHIEQNGILTQLQILEEAKANSALVDESWMRWTREHHARRGIGCFLDRHGDYYRNHYIKNIRPHLDKVPASQLTVSQRMNRQRQAYLRQKHGK